MKYLIGIDIGTSGTKTVLFDTMGNTIVSHTALYPLYQPHNGWAEQDPNDWWNAVADTLKKVITDSKIDSSDIAGIGLSGQMHGLVMLDENGRVLDHAIIWCDGRTKKECDEITEIVGRDRLIEITANPALTGFTASKILWMRKHKPELYKKCRHVLLPKDYIRYQLTGEFATDVSDASGMQLLDVRNRCWSKELLNKLEIEESLLARVYESPEITGRVTGEAAKRTGLCEGTIVVGGAGDNAAAAVGTGVVTDHSAFTTIGTSGVVYAHTSSMKMDTKGRAHTFCCAVPGCWHVMGVTQAAGLSLKWFRDEFCKEEMEQAKISKMDPYVIMDQMAQDVPIGANKLIYLPYLMGERTPHLNPDCRGVFFGFSAMHTKADCVRAVMEGVSYSLRDCMEVLREMNIQPENMMICGGGGRSTLWRQMLADLYQCPVKTVTSKEGPALGAAILAGVGAGIYESVEKGCQIVIHIEKEQKPINENAIKYEKFYKIFKKLYQDLENNFADLANIG